MHTFLVTVRRPLIATLIASTLLAAGCGPVLVSRTQSRTAEHLNPRSEYLKAYTSDGGLYVLHDWAADTAHIHGPGVLLDANRDTLALGKFDLASSSVTMFETNVISRGMSTTGWALIAVVVDAILIGFLTSNMKVGVGTMDWGPM